MSVAAVVGAFAAAPARRRPMPISPSSTGGLLSPRAAYPELLPGHHDLLQARALSLALRSSLNVNPVGVRIVVPRRTAQQQRQPARRPDPRLDAALQLARGFPTTGIITTGGVTNRRAGRSEAAAMKDWLVRHGVAPQRIATENRSGSTVQNARNVAPMLRAGGATGVVVVTSNDHLRRAMVNFRSAVNGSMPVAGVVPGPGNGSGSSSGGSGSMGSS